MVENKLKPDKINKFNINNAKPIAFMIVFLVIFFFGVVVIESTFDNAILIERTTQNDSNIVLTAATQTLTPIGTSITSSEVKANNLTYLDTDGINDRIISDEFTEISNSNASLFIRFKLDGNSSGISFTHPFAIINSTSLSNNYVTLFKQDSSDTFSIKLRNSTSDASRSIFSGVELDTWYDFMFSYDGIKTENYINDTNLTDSFNVINVFNASSFVTKYGTGMNNQYWNGSIDYVIVFDKYLSDIDSKNLYQSKNFKKYNLNYTNLNINEDDLIYVNDTLLYAATGLFINKSTDGGFTWVGGSQYDTTWAGGDATGIFRTSNGTLIIGTDFSGNISVSIGNDSNWTEVQFADCLNQSGDAGWGVAGKWGITETNDNSILIGEYTFGNTSERCGFIHKSTDQGLTWSLVYNASAQFGDETRHVHQVETDPFTGIVYATMENRPTTDSRMIRSLDNGDTWENVKNGSSREQYLSIVFTPEYRILFTDMLGQDRIIRTSDDINFEEVYTVPWSVNGDFWDAKRDNNTGYIIGFTTGNANVISVDNGTTWFTSENGGSRHLTAFDTNGFAIEQAGGSFNRKFNILQNESYTPLIDQKINENSGTTTHDVSGNGYDGTITGATWATDEALKTLTATTDYTINPTTGLFTIVNNDFQWAWMNVSYDYLLDTENSSTSVLKLTGVFIALGLILFLLIPIFIFIRRRT